MLMQGANLESCVPEQSSCNCKKWRKCCLDIWIGQHGKSHSLFSDIPLMAVLPIDGRKMRSVNGTADPALRIERSV